jgi:hypothetical protein
LADQPPIESPLTRPASERARDYKYRFAQCLIFGLPVLALQLFGLNLGGPESVKWVGLFQALLTGWVMYIGAFPILIEESMEIIISGRKSRPKSHGLLVALLSLMLYLIGIGTWVLVLVRGRPNMPAPFAIAVGALILWTGWKWMRLSRQVS